MMPGTIEAVCLSEKKGTAKHDARSGKLRVCYGLEGDAHAGNWHRQVSLLSLEKIRAFQAKGADVRFGDFGENIVASGIDFSSLPVGTALRIGEAVLVVTQIGKECHSHCAIFQTMGDCIMPREGVFAVVVRGGPVNAGDRIEIAASVADAAAEEDMTVTADKAGKAGYRVAAITLSDKGAAGEREDVSGRVIREMVETAGYTVAEQTVLPDERTLLEAALRRIADTHAADLILTTGGTGFSPRDTTPEATLAVADRLVPGIAEAMRTASMAVTKRAMLSRAVSVIRKQTLIVNLPGSPKAVRENLSFILGALGHGLDILTGREGSITRHVHQPCEADE